MQGKLDAMRHLSKIEGIQNTQRKSRAVETKSDKANLIYQFAISRTNRLW